MIKLEDLKYDDIIYRAYKYHWVMKYRVIAPKYEFEYQDLDKPIIYAVKLTNITNNSFLKGEKEFIFEKNEPELFKTLDEAEEYRDKCKQDRIDYLLKDNNLVKSLYLKAESMMNDADKELYKQLINKL